MDWISIRGKGLEGLKKYRYILLVLLLGIFLMALPEGNSKTEEREVEVVPTQPVLQDSLAGILSKISGAGRVEVLLTQATGAVTVYQTDEDRTMGENTTDINRKTVLVSNSGKGEGGLIKQVNPPGYQGAIVVCQGADNAKVKLAIVEAVANATGLSTDRITVLKMK